MADDVITNKMLLEHMQAMRGGLEQKIGSLDNRMTGLEGNVMDLTVEMRQGFEDARQHRKALQEDLEATILLQGKHTRTLARLTRRSAA